MYCSWSRVAWLGTALLLTVEPIIHAYELDPNSTASVKKVSKQMATDLLSFYHPEKSGVGLLGDPYYWYEAGGMFGALIDYWHYTGDDSHNDLVSKGLLSQVGTNNNYMPDEQRLSLGNDDQGIWGMAVMSAAEYNFPNPPSDKPQWLALAQAVFNTQASRWDTETCNGGLIWQIYDINFNGKNYKNSISNACLFAIGARLALYTGNSSYTHWAEKTWDWMVGVDFINTTTWSVYDGADKRENCTKVEKSQWSYNAGGFILGAAAMYNHTKDDVWKKRLDNLLEGSKIFFTGPERNIMAEGCERKSCNLDQQSFKAYFSRWLTAITAWAPHTYDVIMPYLRSSAVAAAKQCTGGSNGRMCGLKWTNNGENDGLIGVGEQMAALEVTLACLAKEGSSPVTSKSGGTSKGDSSAGGDDIRHPGGQDPIEKPPAPITTGQTAGAAIATAVILGAFLALMVWIALDGSSNVSVLQHLKELPASLRAGASTSRNTDGIYSGAVGNMPPTAIPLRDRSQSHRNDRIQPDEASSMNIGHNRYPSSGHQRSSSYMPVGWPNNQNIRGSMLSDDANVDQSRSSPAGSRRHRLD